MIPSRGACFAGGAAAAAIFLLFGMWLLAILAFGTGCALAQFTSPPGLDPERFFSTEDRRTLFENARGRCQNPRCWVKGGAEVHFESDCPTGGDCPLDYQADHKYPHSKGGRTVLSNGACLCRRCNGRKGARV